VCLRRAMTVTTQIALFLRARAKITSLMWTHTTCKTFSEGNSNCGCTDRFRPTFVLCARQSACVAQCCGIMSIERGDTWAQREGADRERPNAMRNERVTPIHHRHVAESVELNLVVLFVYGVWGCPRLLACPQL